MPVYEFYCNECNTIYKFFSLRVNTEKVPQCPGCHGSSLQKRVSMFATVSGTKEGHNDAMIAGMDESKMEKAMAMLASEAEKINEEDPRQAAQLMKKLSDATGMKMGGAMEEALSRVERGEDPATIEQEMGNAFENEEPFSFEGRKAKSAKQKAPSVDDTLYDL